MLSKNTVLGQVTILPNGVINVQFERQISDGTSVEARHYHRVVVAPGDNPQAILVRVNTFLAQQGYPAVSTNDVTLLKNIISLIQTPAVINAYQATLTQPI